MVGNFCYFRFMIQNIEIKKSLVWGISIVITAMILGGAFQNRNQGENTISVTGKAEKTFSSDLIVWRGSFSRNASTLKEAYDLLNQDIEVVKKYLKGKGVKDNEPVFDAVDIQKLYRTETDKDGIETSYFTGYLLTQVVKIESKDVDRIEKLSREVTELINQGLEFNSASPEYYYTQLANLKIEMIAEATKDARLRAEKIAQESGSSLGDLKNGDMGVFQIVAPNSSDEDYSWGGSLNTSSREKSASITMSLAFNVD